MYPEKKPGKLDKKCRGFSLKTQTLHRFWLAKGILNPGIKTRPMADKTDVFPHPDAHVSLHFEGVRL